MCIDSMSRLFRSTPESSYLCISYLRLGLTRAPCRGQADLRLQGDHLYERQPKMAMRRSRVHDPHGDNDHFVEDRWDHSVSGKAAKRPLARQAERVQLFAWHCFEQIGQRDQ